MTERKTNMYSETKIWSVHVGCLFKCIYCRPSFQQQVMRWGKNNCETCYIYYPHQHPERLNKIPSSKIVFVAGAGDISFCPKEYVIRIIESIGEHNKRCPYKEYYIQSKDPRCFKPYLNLLPPNVILVTTLETNRDDGYEKISKAPKPSKRFRDFLELDYPRKVVTVEPIMAFDLNTFSDWIKQIRPEYVWIGYNSKPNRVKLPEPSIEETTQLIETLKANGIQIRGKDLRGIELG